MDKLGVERKRQKEAREYNAPGFQFTRRVIALASVGAIIVAPILAAIFMPGLPISYGFAESVGGFMFFTSATEALVWTTGTGIVIGPVHTHLVYAIAGMYFGSSVVK